MTDARFEAPRGTEPRGNASLFWGLITGVVVADVVTKWLAVRSLVPQRLPHEVLGDVVRLTLVYNPGAAFGLHLGPFSRWIFMLLTFGALAVLWRLFRATRAGELARTLALGLVCGGAIGNLIDRIRSAQGVVDFIDVGIGDWRWPTFNVADMAVSTGAFLLAWVLWGEDRRAAIAAESAEPGAAGAPAAPATATVPPDLR
ncbi:MAG: signal peptidase II [Gemmatimonadaceae bacterium]